MASPLLSWLLRLAALCHLTMLPAGQHHAVNKCNKICSSTTSREIPVDRLISYQQNQASCPKRVIILTTIMNRNICADPNAEWVKQAIKYLEGKAASSMQPSGTVLRQIGVAPPPAARGMDTSAVPEPKATGESSSQEVQRALGTSPELPARVAGSWGTRPPTDSKAPDGGSSAGPERTEIFNAADITTTTSWRNSYVYQTGSNIWAEGKVSEAISTQAPSTQAPSTQTPSTQTLPTQTPSTQTLPTQNPTTQAPSTQALPTQNPTTQAPSTQALPTQTPSTQALATQAPPTISHTAPEDNFGAEGQPVWTNGQDPTPENSLGSTEIGPTSAYMDASMGPGSMPMSPVSEGASSMKPVASSSWTPKAQKMDNLITPVHDPQAATRRQAVGLLAFLGLLFCLGVGMFAYQSLQGCPRNMAGDQVEGLRFVPRSCGSNSYVLVPV